MTPPQVVVVGDVIYDLLARVDDLAFGTDTFTTIHAAAGGSGANTAAWLARLGVETHFVGRVGDDIFGRFLVGELKRAGVVPHVTRDPSAATGKVFVLVDAAGERTMITDRGAGDALGPDDLPGESFREETHLHLSGYLFSGTSRRETAMRAMELARAAGMSVSVDPSSVSLLESIGPGRFLEWTRGVDLCFPNLGEGTLLAGSKGVGDPARVAEALTRHYPGVVLKLGDRGAVYADAGGERVSNPALPAPVVDTTGAGDALCAGFLAVRLGGGSPEEALRRGQQLAARVVAGIGGRDGG